MSIIGNITDREMMIAKKHQLWMINGFLQVLEARKKKLWEQIIELEKKLNKEEKEDESDE